MKTISVPFQCGRCKWMGLYKTLIDWFEVQLQCRRCGQACQVQQPAE